MGCWRFRLRRKLLPYLEGALDSSEVRRIERHLLNCEACRSLTVRLRAGHRIAQQLAGPARDPGSAPDFGAVVRALPDSAPSSRLRPAWQDWRDRLATPRAVSALALLAVLQLALLVASNRGLLFGKKTNAAWRAGGLDWADFSSLSFNQLKSNTRPHVMIEGYVRDVHTDPEEGTVAFKLMESPHAAAPFVV